MIKPLNTHYSFENPASIFDEEAMTALELAGRQGAKINEVVHDQNNLRQETKEFEDLVKTVTVPAEVKAECARLIASGEFDLAISLYLNNLNKRVDNMLSSVSQGSTTLDAEVIDIRVNANGVSEDNAGNSIRALYAGLAKRIGTPNLYLADMVRDTLGITEVFSGDIEGQVKNTNSWQYVAKPIQLPAGNYTVVLEDIHLSPNLGNYGVEISGAITGIKEPGVYEFKIPNGDTRNLILQLSDNNAGVPGRYYARGLHIFEGHFSGMQGLPDYFTGVENRIPVTPGKNLFDAKKATHGYYLGKHGEPIKEMDEYPGQCHSDYIVVKPGENYAINYDGSGGYCAFYDRLKNFIISYSMKSLASDYLTAPENAYFFRFSYQVENEGIMQFEKGTNCTSYKPYYDYAPLQEMDDRITDLENRVEVLSDDVNKRIMNDPDIVVRELLPKNNIMQIKTPNIKHGYSLGFRADIAGSLTGEIYIDRGYQKPYYTGVITINNQKVIISGYNTSAYVVSEHTHGLNIKDFIAVNATVVLNKIYVDITTNGGSFSFESDFNGCDSIVKMNASQELTNVELCYHGGAYSNKVWCFGDSYFDMWPEYVTEKGYTKWAIDAHSGRTTQVALTSFRKALEKATPEKAVWFMGMNNADTDTAISSTWLSATEAFLEECQNRNITPVLATVPNCPERNHSFKNEWVRNSGHRYIDVCRAVGADTSNNWYDGLLSNDNVHPTAEGGKLIANYVMAMLPEIKEV